MDLKGLKWTEFLETSREFKFAFLAVASHYALMAIRKTASGMRYGCKFPPRVKGLLEKTIYKRNPKDFPQTREPLKAWERSQRPQAKSTGYDATLGYREIAEYREAKAIAIGMDLRVVAQFWAERNQPSAINVGEAIEIYEEQEVGKMAVTTQSAIKSKLSWLRECVGEVSLPLVTAEELKKHLGNLPHDVTTVNNYIRSIKRFFSWCCMDGQSWIAHSPAQNILQARDPSAAVQYLSVENVRSFLNELIRKDPCLVPAMALMLFAGIRPYVVDRMAPHASQLINLQEKSVLIPTYLDRKANKQNQGLPN
ncbi:MAG: hypothetical protein LR015_06485 [Verrucomicrobia bacterium]|nr:hypothetical protein [Verrucomicrobiota bacterium]